MSYKSRYGITTIRSGKRDNLVISYDYNNVAAISKFPVFLYTPDMDDTNNHYHIAMNLTQARQLHAWLGEFIKNKTQHKNKK